MKNLQSLCCAVLTSITFSYAQPVWAEIVNITLLQLNDVYEITPVSGGKQGGLARIATLRKNLFQQNSRTYTILAGDCLSPSALGTAKINDVPLAGQQMVAALNIMGLDYATFGNHEFDLKKEQFLQRLTESKFTWFSGNVLDTNGQSFPGVLPYKILTVKGNEGNLVRMGLIGVTLPSNPVNYVTYRDPIATVREQVKQLKDQVDIIVAVTHLSLAEDQKIAETIPEIDLILGGHEHENIQQWRGGDFTPIFKADANGRTVYIHQLNYDTDKKKLEIDSRLQPVTEAIPEDPQTAKVVQDWVDKGYQAFRNNGFEPEQVVAITNIPLDGLEVSVRNRGTPLTDLIAEAMLKTVKDGDLAIYNGGAIRIDDVILPGKITQYDIIRIMPFGGKILSVKMKGSLLEKVLNQGRNNQGTGGYLQTAKVDYNEQNKTWLISGKPLDKNGTYQVAINDFLLSGKEQNLGFLNRQNPELQVIAEGQDIRFAVIEQMKQQFK
jgi:5'-nucleotidase